MKKITVVPPVWLCWFTCLGGLAAYSWAHGDRVISAVISLVAVTGLAGYCLGGGVVLVFLAALTAGSLFARKLVDFFGPMVGDVFGTRDVLNTILATCIGCVTVAFVVTLVFEVVWNRLLGKRGHLRAFNQAVGLSLGAFQGVVLSLMILGGSLVAEPYARNAVRTDVENVRGFVGKCTADSVARVGQASRRSQIGPFIARFNPFERVPQLRQLRQRQWIARRMEFDVANPDEV